LAVPDVLLVLAFNVGDISSTGSSVAGASSSPFYTIHGAKLEILKMSEAPLVPLSSSIGYVDQMHDDEKAF